MASVLKEWAITCEALGSGGQVLVLRKGGIGEKRFALPSPAFYLFPTYAHQRPELVQPHWRKTHAAALAERAEPDRVRLRYWAEVAAAWDVDDPALLPALAPFHALTTDYAAERLRWRRTQPLAALALRVHRIDTPPELALGPELGGCVSWLEIDGLAPPEGARPVLDDAAFETVLARIGATVRDRAREHGHGGAPGAR